MQKTDKTNPRGQEFRSRIPTTGDAAYDEFLRFVQLYADERNLVPCVAFGQFRQNEKTILVTSKEIAEDDDYPKRNGYSKIIKLDEATELGRIQYFLVDERNTSFITDELTVKAACSSPTVRKLIAKTSVDNRFCDKSGISRIIERAIHFEMPKTELAEFLLELPKKNVKFCHFDLSFIKESLTEGSSSKIADSFILRLISERIIEVNKPQNAEATAQFILKSYSDDCDAVSRFSEIIPKLADMRSGKSIEIPSIPTGDVACVRIDAVKLKDEAMIGEMKLPDYFDCLETISESIAEVYSLPYPATCRKNKIFSAAFFDTDSIQKELDLNETYSATLSFYKNADLCRNENPNEVKNAVFAFLKTHKLDKSLNKSDNSPKRAVNKL